MDEDQKRFFAERYRGMDTDELVDIHRKGNLREEALLALETELAQRGVSPDQRAEIAEQLKADSGEAETGHLASLGDRFLAQVMDAIIALAGGIAIGLTTATVFDSQSGGIVIGGLAFYAYLLFSDGLKGGQSLGKRVMDIAVVDAGKRTPGSYWQSFIRNVSLAFLGFIDAVFILGRRRKRLGDYIAGTDVVKAGKRAAAGIWPEKG